MAKAIAYVDGSYNVKTKDYGYGVVFIYKEKEYYYKERFNDEYNAHHQIAGELKGALKAIVLCLKNNIKELDLYYDYIGIEKWFKNEWQAKTKIAIKYKEYAEQVKDKIKVNFYKVKAHSGVKYNEMADKLAKEVVNV